MKKPVIAILGAGLGGSVAAFEIKEAVGSKAEVMVVSQGDTFHFVPSNPWVAVGWRDRDAIEVHLPPIMAKKKIGYTGVGARRVHPQENRLELGDGESLFYDYLVIATGPELAFDEIEGLGPDGFTQSVCHVDHAERAAEAFEAFARNPGPIVVGAVQGASCYGPAYEFAMILDTEL
ncbi:MAG: FAD/NAD(P)-binding oxidoreductase, partial [Phenylobacterium sp.]|nr:FAD/NAD(P)-binding oxidoreductase [Phenylobacterium sp.]